MPGLDARGHKRPLEHEDHQRDNDTSTSTTTHLHNRPTVKRTKTLGTYQEDAVAHAQDLSLALPSLLTPSIGTRHRPNIVISGIMKVLRYCQRVPWISFSLTSCRSHNNVSESISILLHGPWVDTFLQQIQVLPEETFIVLTVDPSHLPSPRLSDHDFNLYFGSYHQNHHILFDRGIECWIPVAPPTPLHERFASTDQLATHELWLHVQVPRLQRVMPSTTSSTAATLNNSASREGDTLNTRAQCNVSAQALSTSSVAREPNVDHSNADYRRVEEFIDNGSIAEPWPRMVYESVAKVRLLGMNDEEVNVIGIVIESASLIKAARKSVVNRSFDWRLTHRLGRGIQLWGRT